MTRRPHATAVVTGGTAGVGRAAAIALHGYAVAVLARGQRGLDSTAREIERAAGRALATHVADIDAVT